MQHILFDLDGTLSDPMVGICSAVQHALRHFNIEVADIRTLTPFIGPPLEQSFRELYGLAPDQMAEAHQAYNEYYLERGMYENVPYDGMAALLARLKGELADTTFTFSFSYPSFRERMHDLFNKETFAKLLPAALARCGETAESAGEKLTVMPEAWKGIVKGKLYPEKNTVLALALVCRMTVADANNLLAVCGFTLAEDNVRDVVVGYLLERQIFNPVMRDKCLAEYSVTNLPIAREKIA